MPVALTFQTLVRKFNPKSHLTSNPLSPNNTFGFAPPVLFVGHLEAL